MKYRIIFDRVSRDEILEAADYIAASSPINAARWYGGLRKAIASLADMPQRCPLARESAAYDEEIRQFVFKSHRVIFTIQGKTVRILHVRHVARRNLTPEELRGDI